MSYTITNATTNDLVAIYQLFEEAIQFQKKHNYIGWNNYDKEFIKNDIQNGFLFKLLNEGEIICIFSICYKDELIWREKEKGDALYLHRVVVNQQFKGERTFQQVLDWAIQFAQEKKLQYIRIDTWAKNEKIIAYYKTYGFAFVENYTTPGTDALPLQHRNLTVALLTLPVPEAQQPAKLTRINELEKVNIQQELATIHEYWRQKIIGQANGQLIKLAKGTGEINWHKHDDQDELFVLYKGHLTIQLRDKNIELYENDMFIVPKGVEHCPKAHGDVSFLIMGLNVTSNAAGGRPENRLYGNAS